MFFSFFPCMPFTPMGTCKGAHENLSWNDSVLTDLTPNVRRHKTSQTGPSTFPSVNPACGNKLLFSSTCSSSTHPGIKTHWDNSTFPFLCTLTSILHDPLDLYLQHDHYICMLYVHVLCMYVCVCSSLLSVLPPLACLLYSSFLTLPVLSRRFRQLSLAFSGSLLLK